MSAQSTAQSPAVSVVGLLGVAFVVLKLCGVITWSWWWVLAPFWAPLAFGVLGIAVIIIVASVKVLVRGRSQRRRS